nr:hypothetical protein [Candidatus Sigynarchaeum springense]
MGSSALSQRAKANSANFSKFSSPGDPGERPSSNFGQSDKSLHFSSRLNARMASSTSFKFAAMYKKGAPSGGERSTTKRWEENSTTANITPYV